MKVKEESEKVGLKLNIQKTKIMASGLITSWDIDGKTVSDFIFGGLQNHCGHVWMWELDSEEGWVPKKWCFWTVVLEESLKSPMDSSQVPSCEGDTISSS